MAVVVLPATGAGTATPGIAVDVVAGENYEKIKVDLGSTGVTTPLTAGQKAMASSVPVVIASDQTAVPVSGPLTDAQLRASAVPISAASLPLPTGASTLGEQQTQTTALQLLDDAVATTGAATPAKGLLAAGTDGTNARALKTDTGGELQVDVLTLPANASVNVAQMAGTATSVNSGNKDAGTQRVVIATDQPKFTVTSNYPLQTFEGSAQTVINLAVDIAASNFSGAPAATFTNNDAACPNAQYAKVMAEFPDWAAAPVAGTVVDLYVLLKDVDGTDDETDAPSGTAAGGAHYAGSFTIAAADALQRRQIVIDLWALGIVGSVTGDFYLRNGTAQNMNNDGGTNCVVKITPFSSGQVA